MANFVYEKANDQHVRNLVAYGKSADSKLYYEAAFTNQVTKADAEYYFAMGALQVSTSAGLFAPVAVKNGTVLTVDLSASSPAVTSWQTKSST